MPTVTATLKLFDSFSSQLLKTVDTVNKATEAFERFRATVEAPIDVSKSFGIVKRQAEALTADLDKTFRTPQPVKIPEKSFKLPPGLGVLESDIKASVARINEMNNALNRTTQTQQRFAQNVNQTNSNMKSLLTSVRNVAAAYLSLKGAQQLVSAADTFVTTQARLGLIVDEGQTAAQLHNAIYAAAQRSFADINTMTDTVSRLGLLAGDAFSNTGEIISFAETLQKAFKLSGASIQEQSAAMYQLTQAMAAGRLQGDEFRSIMENAPLLADAIARSLGVSKGALRDLAAEGKITSDVIKNAITESADEINRMFNQMPMTFGEAFVKLKNTAFMAFEPVFRRMNEWLNSTEGTAMIQSLTNAIQIAAVAADWLIRGLQVGFSIVRQEIERSVQWTRNMAVIFAGLSPLILGAAGAWLAYLAATKAVTTWSNIQIAVTNALKAAQQALNFVLTMNPIMRIIALIGGVVAATLTWIEVSKGLKQALSDAFGFVVDAAEKAINAIIGFVNGAIRAINRVSGFFANLLGVEAKRIEEIQYRADFQGFKRAGQDLIENFSLDKLKATFGLDQFDNLTKNADLFGTDINNSLKQMNKGLGVLDDLAKDGIGKIGKVGEVGKINGSLSLSSEDIRLLREIAEMRAVSYNTTLTPHITFGDMHIRETVDAEEVVRIITEELERELAITGQRVYT